MFYTLIKIVAVNFFILSAFSYVPEEKKITNYLVFRETLCAGLIVHAKPTVDTVNTADTAGTAGTAGTVDTAD